jgi:Domain of Unknown Function (DUF1080)
MTRGLAVRLLALAWLALLSLPSRTAGQPASTWTTLLDGTTLKGWNTLGTANWTIVNGAVEANAGAGFLVTPTGYGDFELVAEIWADDAANSGIFIRCADPKSVTPSSAYEVNIFDKRPDPKYRTGAIVDVAEPAVAVNAAGRWNILEIRAQGPHLVVTLNGMKTVDVEHSGHVSGPIALQYMAGVVRFRQVRIRML